MALDNSVFVRLTDAEKNQLLALAKQLEKTTDISPIGASTAARILIREGLERRTGKQ